MAESSLISIIIPSYNSSEALKKNLGYLKDFLNKQKYKYEIVIVDDGSIDNGKTKEIANTFKCSYYKLPQNMGKGAALREGFLNAKGKYKIFTDADVPYETNAINDIIYYLDEQGYCMVIGDRTLNKSDYYTKVKIHRNILSKIFAFMGGYFILGAEYDTQCGIKGFRGDVADELFKLSKINRFAIDIEILYLAIKRNYSIKKINVNLRSQDGVSINVFRDGFRMIIDILKIIKNYHTGIYGRK
jgi:dolichyl-phosphate beta-glucosyltransferase